MTLRDLTGVSYVARSPMVLVVPASSPYKTLQDYVGAAKKKGAVAYASVGAGSSNHLAAELFHETAGTSGLHVPFKGGGPAIADLLGGHVDSMIASLPLVLQQVQGGKLRALAVTSPKSGCRPARRARRGRDLQGLRGLLLGRHGGARQDAAAGARHAGSPHGRDAARIPKWPSASLKAASKWWPGRATR